MDNLEFYNEHKDKAFKLEALPDLPLEEQVRWILAQKHIGWLELDLSFNTDYWKIQSFEAGRYYQEYRDSISRGWASCCLHGIDVEKTLTADQYGFNELLAPYQWTRLAKSCPSIMHFWKDIFPHNTYTRIRFMRISPGGWIGVHNDGQAEDPLSGILPINVAVIHPKNCEMVIEDCGTVPWQEGKIMLLNVSKNHAVYNHSSKERIHMIANVVVKGNIKFYELLVRSYNKQYELSN